MARSPAFDRIVREGVLFTHTFNPVPSCSPTRGCLLTGRYAHELGERGDAWMRETHDPRVDPAYDGWDAFHSYGKPSRRE